MDTAVFVSTFALIFLAEIGDKSQLIAMMLASRYRALPVFIGTASAFALLNLFGVIFGAGLAKLLPRPLLLGGAGALFLAFAWKAWRDSAEGFVAAPPREAKIGAIGVSFALVFLAELGDKTQLAVVALASRGEALVTLFAASTAAECLVALIGIYLGRKFLTRVPLRWLHRGVGLGFAILGGMLLLEALRTFSLQATTGH